MVLVIIEDSALGRCILRLNDDALLKKSNTTVDRYLKKGVTSRKIKES